MPFSSRIDANVLGVRSFQAIEYLRSVEVDSERMRGAPVVFSRGKTRRLVPSVRTLQGRVRFAVRPLREALRAREQPGVHRVEQRLRTRSAHLALGVEPAA